MINKIRMAEKNAPKIIGKTRRPSLSDIHPLMVNQSKRLETILR